MKLIKRGRYYHAKIHTADGISTVSTKATNHEEAAKIVAASGLKDLERAGRAGRLTNEAIGRIVTGRKLTIGKALEHFAKWQTAVGSSPKTIENNITTVAAWAKAARVEHLPPAAIDENHINDWINDPDEEAKASTRAVKLSSLRTFFGYCAAKGWCVGDPAKLVKVNLKVLSHGQKERDEREPFLDVEIKRLKSHLIKQDDIFWLFAVTLSNEIGLRLGDICQLEWSCFEVPHKIVVWTDKRDTRVAVPISAEIDDLITRIPIHSARYVFPNEREIVNDVKRRSNLSVYFGRILEAAGIKGKSFHCLRHTCATRWQKQGKTLESIGEDLGHADTKTTAGYVH